MGGRPGSLALLFFAALPGCHFERMANILAAVGGAFHPNRTLAATIVSVFLSARCPHAVRTSAYGADKALAFLASHWRVYRTPIVQENEASYNLLIIRHL